MKRILSAVLVLVLLLSAMPWAAAARDVSSQESLAEDLKELSLFKGVSDTDFDLGRAPSRVEALVMLVRVLGKEQEALSGSWSHPFTDVDAWADAYVGYAYEHGLTTGISDTRYGKGDADAKTYLTFVLRALGYSDANGQDFTWSQPYALASEVGVLPEGVDLERFWRADIVTVSYAALTARLKGSDRTLSEKLMADGVFTPEQFQQSFDPDALKKAPGPDGAGGTQPEQEPDTEAGGGDDLTARRIAETCSDAVFTITCYAMNGRERRTASGFFLTPDGLAVTSYRAVADARVTATTTDGTVYEDVDILDGCKDTDLVLLRINGGSGFRYLELGDSDALRQGQQVYAIGSVPGQGSTVSRGIISDLRRTLDRTDYIQISAPIAPSGSGGALLDESGRLVGVTTTEFKDASGALNLAAGSNFIRELDRSSTSSYVFWADNFYPGFSYIYDFGAFSGVELLYREESPGGCRMIYDIRDFHTSPMLGTRENFAYTVRLYTRALASQGFRIPHTADPEEGIYAEFDKEAVFFWVKMEDDPCIYVEVEHLA